MLKQKKIIIIIASLVLVIAGLIIGAVLLYPSSISYGFEAPMPEAEKTLRLSLIEAAEAWIDCAEADGSHRTIIDLYNGHEPLAQGYQVKYDDEWCATFVSAAAIKAGLTEIIPTECGCQRQIRLFEELGCWQEADDYKPLPGDIIYYSRSNSNRSGECTTWADHVGIVVGTNGNRMKVIEGNYGDKVDYRYIKVDGSIIRGFATPNYTSLMSN